MKETNNTILIGGKTFFKRWTILKVEKEVVDIVKKYGSDNGYTTSKSLSKLIRKGYCK